VSVLDASGIVATKVDDPASGVRVEVARDDAARAVEVLTTDGMTPARPERALSGLIEGAVVPSREAERARIVAGIAGELERSLANVDGVVSARVHVAAPGPDPLVPDVPEAAPTASVLIRFRGARAPMPDADVQRLVAYAVPGLTPERVSVMALPARPFVAPDVVRLGPLLATRSAARTVRFIVAGVAILDLALVAFLLVFWTRLRRLRSLEKPDGAHDPP
jgi:type III secretion protein J